MIDTQVRWNVEDVTRKEGERDEGTEGRKREREGGG